MASSHLPEGGISPGPMGPEVVVERLLPLYGPFTWEPRYSPLEELLFTILSQHTSDLNAERAFRSLMRRFDSLESIAGAEVSAIQASVATAGLSRIKAPRIKGVLQEVQRRAGSLDIAFLKEWPLREAKAWLRSLPGVGPKSAAVVLCFALGMPAMPVDTHVYRVARRLGFLEDGTTPEQAHDILEAAVAPGQVFAFHMALITHGRRVCKARRPLCHQCILSPGCPSSLV